MSVTLKTPLANLPFGIGIGSADTSIIARFGSPVSDDIVEGVRTLSYDVGEEVTDSILFRLRSGPGLRGRMGPFH